MSTLLSSLSFLFASAAPRRQVLSAAVSALAFFALPAAWAQARRAKAAAPRRYPLRAGAFFWMPQVASSGPSVVVVNVYSQMVQVFRNGVCIGVSSVSTGKPGYGTPTGMYPILEKKRFHRSSTYDNAPMPYMLRLTWMGVALHVGHLPGYPASHGCIRLPAAFAPKLFAAVGRGERVWVVNRALAEPMAMLAPITPMGTALLVPEAYTQAQYWDTVWLSGAGNGGGNAAGGAPVVAQALGGVASSAGADVSATASTQAAVLAQPVELGIVASLSQKRLYVLHQGYLVAALALPESVAQTEMEGGAVWSWQPSAANGGAGQWLPQAAGMADIADLPAKILPPNSSFVQRLYPRMAAGSLLFVSQLPAISDLHLAAPSA